MWPPVISRKGNPMLWEHYWRWFCLAILVLPLLASAAFAHWMRRRPALGGDVAVKYWEVFIKLMGAITVVVTGAFVFGKYIDQKVQAERADFLKHKGAYVERRIEMLRGDRAQAAKLFQSAAGAAAKLANPADPAERKLGSPVRAEFEQLYWASLIGVERPGGEVETAMVRFREAVEADTSNLHQNVLAIARACVAELAEKDTKIRDVEDQAIALHQPPPDR